ncbi:MAG: hypothetical protein NC084_01080 [Bacteroides sp.]|nr:hypothetical protein [Eubacterium sp.]MCM1417845.1 hypothetical protein [Roseburia sp.]MCM1461284.1 hypothetical protein [Bacteroides sp.]
MKKVFLSFIFTFLYAFAFAGITASAEGELSPIYADRLNDGTYRIEVESSSSMFRVVDCRLVVADGKMTAFMTMSGQGYGLVYLGTGEEALAADSADYIEFTLDDEGQKVFAVEVAALDQKIDCAAWSIKKEQWYDRELIFRSDTLPEGALKEASLSPLMVVASAVLASAIAVAIVLYHKKRGGK